MASNSATSYYDALVKMQKMSDQTQKELQTMVNKANKSQMDFNKSEASTARSWQEKMSKNSHLYEVRDLKQAGLNPVLSANNGGAASYTTSSASTQNESGAQAAAALQGSKMAALGNMESSRLSANANIKSATMNADAVRRAALISAEAQREAAKTSAEAQKYQAKMNYKSTKYRADTDADIAKKNRANQRYMQQQEFGQRKWEVKNQTSSTWAGIVDKNLRNFGLYDDIKNLKDVFSLKTGNSIKKDSRNFTNKKGSKVTESNFKLSSSGKSWIRDQLKLSAMSHTDYDVKLYVKAVCFGNNKALAELYSRSPFAVKPGRR